MKKITKLKSITGFLLSVLIVACQPQNSQSPSAGKSSKDQALQDRPLQENNQQQESQPQQFAKQLTIVYRHIENQFEKTCEKSIADGNCFLAEFQLTLEQPVELKNWKIFFSFMGPIRETLSEEFLIRHINGDLHSLEPTEKFRGWQSGASKKVPFKAAFWQLTEFDVPPNFYVVGEDNIPYVIKSTRANIDPQTQLEELSFVEAFGSSELQSKRTGIDSSQLATAENLFEHNQLEPIPVNKIDWRIIPQPKLVEVKSANARLTLLKGISLLANDFKIDEKNPAIQRLQKLGIQLTSSNGIPLKITRSNQIIGEESYQLKVTDSAIEISASTDKGAFYGLQSLSALITPGSQSIPQVFVNDSPRFEFRGLHLDVARNFRDKNFVLKLLEQMAAYKLNKLHLHLGDDEGWRMEIPELPELTQVGAQRCHDLEEQNCLLPQLGSGPNVDDDNNGFYSVDDYQQILQVASQHHIQVIPSFDMPGHSRAAVKSMQARYQKYQAAGQTELANEYLLSDVNDQSQYLSVQYYKDNTLNVCKESTYRFVEKVLQSVIAIHQQAQVPLTTYHIGADETAGAWKGSPECKDFMRDKQLKVEQLSDYFIRRVAKFLSEQGIIVAGWSDGLAHLAKNDLPEKVQINVWKPLFWEGHKVAHHSANKDWRVVVSSPDVTYFDFPYEVDPKERGYYWGSRYTNTRQVFEFMPENLPLHAEIWTDRENQPFIADDRPVSSKDKSYMPMQKGKSFYGLQGHLWSEMVRSDQIAEYMLFPRLIALAERAWHRADWETEYQHQGQLYSQDTSFFNQQNRKVREQQWAEFAGTLAEKELPKLDIAGWRYRLPTVGAKVVEGKLYINSVFPGLKLQYQLDKGEWHDYVKPQQGVAVVPGQLIRVRSKTHSGQRFGRSLPVKN